MEFLNKYLDHGAPDNRTGEIGSLNVADSVVRELRTKTSSSSRMSVAAPTRMLLSESNPFVSVNLTNRKYHGTSEIGLRKPTETDRKSLPEI